MLFTIENVSYNDLSVLMAKFNARRFVLLCQKHSNELALNKYLFEKYKTALVPACLKIINNATYSSDSQGNLIITILDKKLDKLASIITYGTGKVQGSNILRYAFGKI